MPPNDERWRKLGVRDGDRLVLLGAPASWDDSALPAGVRAVRGRSATPADVVVAFFSSKAALRRAAPRLEPLAAAGGMVWVAWPRRAGGHGSDLTDAVVRSMLLDDVLVDVKVAALDEDWSGVKFVRRRTARPTTP